MITVPVFKNTEEALEFGLKHKGNEEVLAILRFVREKSLEKSRGLRESALEEAVKGQFYREALEVAEER